LEKALGQFVLYRMLLQEQDPQREMFLAIPSQAYDSLFSVQDGLRLISSCQLKVIVYDYED